MCDAVLLNILKRSEGERAGFRKWIREGLQTWGEAVWIQGTARHRVSDRDDDRWVYGSKRGANM